jgi:hypothetical protein
MQELIKKITDTAGVTEEQAKKSIYVISGYIKERVPDSFKSQIDNLVNGGTLSEGMKAQLNEVASEFRDKAETVIDEVRDKLSEIFGKPNEKK